MDRKEVRVCVTCHGTLTTGELCSFFFFLKPACHVQRPSVTSRCPSAPSCEGPFPPSGQSPNPNNPAEYCSTVPPLQQAQASGALGSPPPTVMVPVGVLKQPGNEGMLFRAGDLLQQRPPMTPGDLSSL